MILPRTIVEHHLDEAREIGSQHLLYDIHVHPFELLLKPIRYRPDPRIPGVLTVENSAYRKPSARQIDLAVSTESGGIGSSTDGASSLQALMAYRHTGWQVLADRMTLSGIGACMLLPVPMTLEKVEHDLRRVERLQDADPKRLMYAVGVPGDVTDANAFLGNVCSQFSPRAVKRLMATRSVCLSSVNSAERLGELPNATIDISTPAGISSSPLTNPAISPIANGVMTDSTWSG